MASSLVINQNEHVALSVAERPLSSGAVDLSFCRESAMGELERDAFRDMWEARSVAEQRFRENGCDNLLCYSKIKSGESPRFHLVPYSSLPSYLDNVVFRTLWSICQQIAVLFRTIFPPSKLSSEGIQRVRSKWTDLGEALETEEKTGKGPLCDPKVIAKQVVFPQTLPEASDDHLLLYNYAPVSTEGKLHFLVVPHPDKPAKNFAELGQDQYVRMMELTRKVVLWAQKEFEGKATVHVMDKQGKIAGQTQPLYHFHIIIVPNESDEIWGKLAMLFRMFIPPSPLGDVELKAKVEGFRETLGAFLAQT